MVESVTNSGNGWTETYSYTYDANVNITQIYKGNTLIHAYTYDSLNQLTQDIDYTAGTTTTYTYDRGGNILSSLKVNTATNATLESHTYSYTNSNWKDQLTAFDGNPITYDANGTPLTYNGMTLTWTQGRRLASISGTGLSASYSYNENGIRVSKTVNGVTTNYLLDGTRIIKQSDGTDVLWYYYDATGSVVSFDLNGTPYYYVKNLQGDILAITNASGQKVVEYSYEAWGKVESITGSLVGTVGAKNPFRYRGYYYDAETEWYYLFNRYYYPGAYRWISADEYCSTSQTLVEQNMFNYCGNNPLFRKDSSGDFWEAIVVGF